MRVYRLREDNAGGNVRWRFYLDIDDVSPYQTPALSCKYSKLFLANILNYSVNTKYAEINGCVSPRKKLVTQLHTDFIMKNPIEQ